MDKLGQAKAFLPAFSLLVFLISTNAVAGTGCATLFSTTYPGSQTDDNAGCQTCHERAGGGPFNPYGSDLRANGAAGAGFNCDVVTAEIDFDAALAAVENLDSDNDIGGFSNIDEITAGTQPGWCVFVTGGTCLDTALALPAGDLDPAPANQAPLADAGGPYEGVAGTTLIQFDGSGSTDADNDPLTFDWDFGDGSTASGMMPTHTYAAAGDYQVTLIVDDSTVSSEPSIASAVISEPVINLAPVADPGGPYANEPGVAVQFDGAGSTDPNGDALSYAWDFGDGAMGDSVSPTHVYAADGVYTVTLVVSDGRLDSDASTTTAEIATPPANRAPVADAGGPYTGETGVEIMFDGSRSSDADGDTLTYSWNFGDGSVGTGAMPTHIYSAAGDFTVSLIVNDGEFDSAAVVTVAGITDTVVQSDGQMLYDANCGFCHGDPWDGPAIDGSLSGLRRVAGARSCNIYGSIFGTSVFPDGVPEMQFLQGITEAEIGAMADYLNSKETSGEQRYVTTCAGCHGNDGSGGRSGEDVRGESAGETWEAIHEESEMRYMACMPRADINIIADFLKGFDDDFDDDDDRRDDDDGDGGGSTGMISLLILGLLGLRARKATVTAGRR